MSDKENANLGNLYEILPSIYSSGNAMRLPFNKGFHMQFKVFGFANHEEKFEATVELNAHQVNVLRNGRPHGQRVILDTIRNHDSISLTFQEYCIVMQDGDFESRPDLADSDGEVVLLARGEGCGHCTDEGEMTDKCDNWQAHGDYMLRFKPAY